MTLGSRIRELKRKILHTHDPGLRKIYKDHIKFLESQKEIHPLPRVHPQLDFKF